VRIRKGFIVAVIVNGLESIIHQSNGWCIGSTETAVTRRETSLAIVGVGAKTTFFSYFSIMQTLSVVDGSSSARLSIKQNVSQRPALKEVIAPTTTELMKSDENGVRFMLSNIRNKPYLTE
jgi:hypothetical protein